MGKLKNFKQALDYKKAMTTHLADLKDQHAKGLITEDRITNAEGKLFLHTQTAMIEGSINLFQAEETNRTFMEYGLAQFDEEMGELSGELDAYNVSAPIHLKDVTIQPLANPEVKTSMSEMMVYSDQVVGLSISFD
ncbi:hypothetical protein [Halobacillus halophilus]|uniref:hypothetical protein n=1 Tax=Halobacillus halophilus TaxID=1570 RepID=UPI001CD29862|nr:hypothetical protein [Halobacillus halophilus]MCA1010590.1 hypothetical protein [Halobacillus halophilus]